MFKKSSEGENQNQKQSYMVQLDDWIGNEVIEPLYDAWKYVERVGDEESAKEAAQEAEEIEKAVHKAIREKVLESYRNGMKAKGSKPTHSSFRRN
jgi:hypothetical protein